MFLRPMDVSVALALVLVGCIGRPLGGTEPDTVTTEEAPDNPFATPIDAGDRPGQGGGQTTPTDGTAPTEPEPEPTPTRFVVLGDGGRGNSEQYAVAAALEQHCAKHGCDFALHVGDNIYDSGVSGVDDPQFVDKFEAPYAKLSFPFYMVLGNHDHDGGQESVDAEIAYTSYSARWRMPARFYSITEGDATFFGIDSDSIAGGDSQDQADWLAASLPKAATTWKFAFGHHPYVSNGDHGNTGGDFEAFFDTSLCGKVDVYFAGHDHDLQWLEPVCGTEHIGSGAVSDLRSVGGGNPTFFEASTYGFLRVEILEGTFTGVFYDVDGNELFRRTLKK